jgi:hypothetical protein
MNKINLGITVLIDKPTESFFTNGIRQNAIIMRDLYKKIDFVGDVYYVNFGKQKDYSQSPWKEYEENIIQFEEMFDKINVLVVSCVTINKDIAELAKKKGIKIVHHIMGNEYYSFVESVLFKKEETTVFSKERHYDAVWISPHLYETNKDIFEVSYECPAYAGAYVWSPQFLEQHVNALYETKKIASKIYNPAGIEQKRLGVFEPNLSFMKNSIFPILIGEKLQLKHPELLDSLNLFGSSSIKDKKQLINFVKTLEIQKNKKIFFEDRYPIAWALFQHTDILLSHTHHCDLNYVYFDAAWLGFPVVHNSKFIKKLGWYYDEFDADDAVKQIKKSINYFDNANNREKYLKNSKEFISAYLPTQDKNVEAYKLLLEKMF